MSETSPKTETAQRAERTQQLRKWLVPAGIVLLAAVLIAVIAVQSIGGDDGNEAKPETSQSDTQQKTDDTSGETETEQPPADDQAAAEAENDVLDLRQLETRHPDDPLGLGDVNAPIAMIVFSDYQCKFCAAWTHNTLPELKRYVDSGDLYIEWREVNIYEEPSVRAAQAAYAAALQGKHLEYHDALFAGGKNRSAAELSVEALTELARDLGLDVEQFTADFNSETTVTEINAITEFARQLGIRSTPTFVLDGQVIQGAQPTETFVNVIEQQLAAAKQ